MKTKKFLLTIPAVLLAVLAVVIVSFISTYSADVEKAVLELTPTPAWQEDETLNIVDKPIELISAENHAIFLYLTPKNNLVIAKLKFVTLFGREYYTVVGSTYYLASNISALETDTENWIVFDNEIAYSIVKSDSQITSYNGLPTHSKEYTLNVGGAPRNLKLLYAIIEE